MKGSVIALATLAMLFVLCGSGFLAVAPGDGMTILVTAPCWLLGLSFAVSCFIVGGLRKENRELVLTFCLLAVLSVVYSIWVSVNYVPGHRYDSNSNEPIYDISEASNSK